MISSLQGVTMVTRARRCSNNNFGRKMDLLFSVIVLELVFVSGQSPCPGVFDYQTNDGQVFGVITLQPSGPTSSVVLRANFTIAARLPTSYVGQVQPIDQERGLQRYNQGAPLVYRVQFPVTSPLPRLYALVVNDRTICYGPIDVPGPNQYISTISLQHMLFLRGGVNSVFPINTPNRQNFVKPNNGFNSQVGDTQVFTFTDDGLGGFQAFVVDKNGDPNLNVYQTQRTTTQLAFNPFTTQRPSLDLFTTQRPSFNQFPIQQPPQDYNPYTTQRPPQPPPDYNPYTTIPPQQPPLDYNPYTTERPRPPPRPSIPASPPRRPSGSDISRVECGTVAGAERQTLVNKGDDYERGQWPWLVAIFTRKNGGLTFSCGGTLISDRHIVTAAHCINEREKITSSRDIVVKIGVHDLDDWSDDESVTRALENAKIHDSYNSSVIANDIAVFTLDKAVTFSNTIRPACLWDGNSDQNRIVGASGVVVGWGFTETSMAGRGPPKLARMPVVSTSTCRASKPAFHLLTSDTTLCAGHCVAGRGPPKLARMPVVSTSTCRASKPAFHLLTSDTTLCAGDRGGSGPCQGDSGGGLYILDDGRWRLRGVVSLSLRPENGDDSCLVDQYIIFTDAAKFNPWIKTIVRSSQL